MKDKKKKKSGVFPAEEKEKKQKKDAGKGVKKEKKKKKQQIQAQPDGQEVQHPKEQSERQEVQKTGMRSEKTGAKLQKQPEVLPAQDQAAVFRALGDSVRLQIVELLLEQPGICGADLLKSLSIVQSTLSHHMKVLCEAGVVNSRKQGRWSFYSVNQETIKQAGAYLKRYEE